MAPARSLTVPSRRSSGSSIRVGNHISISFAVRVIVNKSSRDDVCPAQLHSALCGSKGYRRPGGWPTGSAGVPGSAEGAGSCRWQRQPPVSAPASTARTLLCCCAPPFPNPPLARAIEDQSTMQHSPRPHLVVPSTTAAPAPAAPLACVPAHCQLSPALLPSLLQRGCAAQRECGGAGRSVHLGSRAAALRPWPPGELPALLPALWHALWPALWPSPCLSDLATWLPGNATMLCWLGLCGTCACCSGRAPRQVPTACA